MSGFADVANQITKYGEFFNVQRFRSQSSFLFSFLSLKKSRGTQGEYYLELDPGLHIYILFLFLLSLTTICFLYLATTGTQFVVIITLVCKSNNLSQPNVDSRCSASTALESIIKNGNLRGFSCIRYKSRANIGQTRIVSCTFPKRIDWINVFHLSKRIAALQFTLSIITSCILFGPGRLGASLS